VAHFKQGHHSKNQGTITNTSFPFSPEQNDFRTPTKRGTHSIQLYYRPCQSFCSSTKYRNMNVFEAVNADDINLIAKHIDQINSVDAVRRQLSIISSHPLTLMLTNFIKFVFVGWEHAADAGRCKRSHTVDHHAALPSC